MKGVFLAWLLTAPPSAPANCFTAGEAAFLAGRLDEAARLYREAARQPACATDAPLLRLNGALALSRTLDGLPHPTYCTVSRELKTALAQGLAGKPRNDAEDQRLRAEQLCRAHSARSVLLDANAERRSGQPESGTLRRQAGLRPEPRVKLLDTRLEPTAMPLPAPSIQALLPDDGSIGPDSSTTYVDEPTRPVLVSALTAGTISAAGAAAMFALSLRAERERTAAGVQMIAASNPSTSLEDARERYSAADRDVVEFSGWFYGLTSVACVSLTTAFIFWLVDDEPAPEVLARSEDGGT